MIGVRTPLVSDRVKTLSSGRGPAGLRGAEEVWERLAAASDNFTQHPAWARACAEAHPTREVRVVAVGDRALAPLVRRQRGAGSWEMLGPDALSNPADFLWSDHAALDALCAELARSGTPLFLDRVHTTSPTLAAIRRAYRGRGVVLRIPAPASPWVPLDPPPASAERLLGRGKRRTLRNGRNRAAELGGVHAEVLSPTPAELPPLLDELYRVEASGWKGRLGTALALDPVWGSLVKRYAADAAAQGSARVGILRIGERVAAVALTIELGGRIWCLKFGYDESFAFCSPGQQLILELLRYAIARGLFAFELMGIHADYKTHWTRSARPCVLLLAYPFSAGGLAALAADGAYLVRRRVQRRALEARARHARQQPAP